MAHYTPAPAMGRGRGNHNHPYAYSPYEARGRGARFSRGRGGRGRGATYPSAISQQPPEVHARFDINGISFELINGGSKLNRLTRTSSTSTSTPRAVIDMGTAIDGQLETPPQHEIAGIKFYRTKGGNLLRHKEYIERQEKLYDTRQQDRQKLTRSRKNKPKKSTEPCAKFSQTGTFADALSSQDPIDEPRNRWDSKTYSCRVAPFESSGSVLGSQRKTPGLSLCLSRRTTNVSVGQCTRECLFVHDFEKVAACRSFLLKHYCSAGPDCSLSHDLTPNRTPMCIYFARGNCTNAECPYTHVRPQPGAPVCNAFGKLGYCDLGAECLDVHVFECPDFANTGHCPNKGCRLPHVERAGQLRKRAGVANGSPNDTSDENTDVQEDPDDPESDDAVGESESNSAFTQQQDYIRL